MATTSIYDNNSPLSAMSQSRQFKFNKKRHPFQSNNEELEGAKLNANQPTMNTPAVVPSLAGSYESAKSSLGFKSTSDGGYTPSTPRADGKSTMGIMKSKTVSFSNNLEKPSTNSLLKSHTDKPTSVGSSGGSGYSGATGAVSAGVGVGASLLANSGAQELSRSAPMQGEYGTQSVDIDALGKKATKDSISTGMTTGATVVGTAGSFFGPIGTLVGTAIGAIVGGVTGWIGGNKKAARVKKEAWNDFNKKELVAKARQRRKTNADQYGFLYEGKTGTEGNYDSYKHGGMVKVKPNIIAHGKLHRENNNLGNRDKGLPVIDKNGRKLIEIEKEEWILNPESAETITSLTKKYNRTKDDRLLVRIGKMTASELLDKTDDKSARFIK